MRGGGGYVRILIMKGILNGVTRKKANKETQGNTNKEAWGKHKQ